MWQTGSTLRYLGQVRRSRNKVHSHRSSVAKTVGATSSKDFLVHWVTFDVIFSNFFHSVQARMLLLSFRNPTRNHGRSKVFYRRIRDVINKARTTVTSFTQSINQSNGLLHFAWSTADAKCILITAVCVCVSLAAFSHYCADPGVSSGNGRGFPLVVHYWAGLQSVHGFCCYDNTAPNAQCQRVLLLALRLVGYCSTDSGLQQN